jgi:low temperature requirement protein LtrA
VSEPSYVGTPDAAPPARVSTLELFFDLVFVFTITQLTAVLANHLSWRSVAEVILMAIVIMWMYGGYAWLTNAIAPNSRSRRTLILIGMGGFLAIALAIPTAFAAAGWVFGLGYFVVTTVHTVLFSKAGGTGVLRAMRTLGPLNFVSSSLVLIGGFTPDGWRWGLWIAAALVEIASPYINPIAEFTISPAHFVERHGLIIIIALGESVVAIGAGAAGLPVDWRLLTIAMLGLALGYLLWWVYFSGDDTEAEHALTTTIDPARRALVAIHAYGWAHLGLLLGIVALAAGVKKTIAHPEASLPLPVAVLLAAGVALYLGSDAVFRRILHISRIRYRAGAAIVAFATVPLGLWLGAAQLAGLFLVIGAMLSIEVRGTGRMDHRTYGVSSHGGDDHQVDADSGGSEGYPR